MRKRIPVLLLIGLGLAAAAVFAPAEAQAALTNVALGKTATASTSYSASFPPAEAVDDYWNLATNSWVSTTADDIPYWRVDLAGTYDVGQVVLHHRWRNAEGDVHINGAYIYAYADDGAGGVGVQVGNAVKLTGYTNYDDTPVVWRQTWNNNGSPWNGVRFIEVRDSDNVLPHAGGTMQLQEVRVMANLAAYSGFVDGGTCMLTSATTPLYDPTNKDVSTEHLVDSVGMADQGVAGWGSPTALANVINAGLWHTTDMYDNTTGALLGDLPELTFDLHGKCDMDRIAVWNLTQAGNTQRGFEKVNVSYSTDGGSTYILLPDTTLDDGNYVIAQATADAPNDADLIIDMTTMGISNATHIRIAALSSYWSTSYAGAEYFGLSEVRFYGDLTSAPIPGDTNNDKKVDAADAKNVASNWGGAVTHGDVTKGDFNNDGLVNAADASILAANWGDYTEGAGQGSVPEPSVAVLLLGVALAVVARRTRR